MKKILIIDDSTLSRTIIKKTLGEEVYQFIEAEDGISGLEKFFLEKPDLVILDLTMPGMNGMDALAKIREMDPRAKVLIGTADIQEFSQQQAANLGAAGFLTKPFSPAKIQQTVESTLAKDHGN
jgi:two-component system, chemotaxis family, chemotaxis protein CheY